VESIAKQPGGGLTATPPPIIFHSNGVSSRQSSVLISPQAGWPPLEEPFCRTLLSIFPSNAPYPPPHETSSWLVSIVHLFVSVVEIPNMPIADAKYPNMPIVDAKHPNKPIVDANPNLFYRSNDLSGPQHPTCRGRDLVDTCK
jgi:hypothetical protein